MDDARRAALRALRRRAGVLLQLGRRGERGGDQVRAQGDRQARHRRARGLVPRPHAPARSRSTGQPAKRAAFEPLLPGVTFARLNDVASLEAAVGPDTGLILLEPVQGEGGVHPARRPGSSPPRRARRPSTGALLCFDEVQTGVGRTGSLLRLRAARRPARTSSRSRKGSRTGCRSARCSSPTTRRRLRARRPRLDVRRQPGRLRGRVRRRRDASTTSCSRTSGSGARSSPQALARSAGAGLLLGARARRARGAGRRRLPRRRPARHLGRPDHAPPYPASDRHARGDRPGDLDPPGGSLVTAHRRERQGAILRLIRERQISTQAELADALREDGLRGRPDHRLARHRRARARQGARGERPARLCACRRRRPRPPARARAGVPALGAVDRGERQPRRRLHAARLRGRARARRSTSPAIPDVLATSPGDNTILVVAARGRHRRRPARRAGRHHPRRRHAMSTTAVLAYSGGLDTTCIIAWLKEFYGYDEVVAVLVRRRPGVRPRAGAGARLRRRRRRRPPASTAARRSRTSRCAKALKTNALYEGKYPLVSALSRPVIAEAVAELALELGAEAAVHGCTGKGNDQLRFELAFRANYPGVRGDRAAPRPGLDARRGDRVRPRATGSRSTVDAGARRTRSTRTCSAASIEAGMLEDPWEAPPEEPYLLTLRPGRRARRRPRS